MPRYILLLLISSSYQRNVQEDSVMDRSFFIRHSSQSIDRSGSIVDHCCTPGSKSKSVKRGIQHSFSCHQKLSLTHVTRAFTLALAVVVGTGGVDVGDGGCSFVRKEKELLGFIIDGESSSLFIQPIDIGEVILNKGKLIIISRRNKDAPPRKFIWFS